MTPRKELVRGSVREGIPGTREPVPGDHKVRYRVGKLALL